MLEDTYAYQVESLCTSVSCYQRRKYSQHHRVGPVLRPRARIMWVRGENLPSVVVLINHSSALICSQMFVLICEGIRANSPNSQSRFSNCWRGRSQIFQFPENVNKHRTRKARSRDLKKCVGGWSSVSGYRCQYFLWSI